MQHSICEELNTDLYKHGDIEHIDISRNNHVPDSTSEQVKHHTGSSNLDNEKTPRSILSINTLPQCFFVMKVQILFYD